MVGADVAISGGLAFSPDFAGKPEDIEVSSSF